MTVASPHDANPWLLAEAARRGSTHLIDSTSRFSPSKGSVLISNQDTTDERA